MSTSTRFERMWPFIKKWEGTAYEDDKNDPGGPTKFGIDKRSHPKEDIRNLTEERAKEIYWEEYWQKAGCENMLDGLGEVVFNCAVNCGHGRVKQFLAVTRDANEFLDEQEAFYRRLVEKRPKSKKYLKGWLNRTKDLRAFLRI